MGRVYGKVLILLAKEYVISATETAPDFDAAATRCERPAPHFHLKALVRRRLKKACPILNATVRIWRASFAPRGQDSSARLVSRRNLG
jgi:hypothetical protein